MTDISQNFIAVLQYLLPGLLCAWVYYGLTPHPKPSEFERIVQALIFTLLVQAVAYPAKALLLWAGKWWALAPWPESGDLVLSVVCALALGVLVSFFANTDHIHRLLRRCGITRETSYPSEWFGAFSSSVTYVVLHLKNDVRLYGWPMEWPSNPSTGHFVLAQACWLDQNNVPIELTNVSHVLIDATEVRLVEFMNLDWREPDEKSAQSTPT